MRFISKCMVVLLIITTGCHQSFRDNTEIKDLSGTWKLQLDPDNVGMRDKWFNKAFTDSIPLPGTTDESIYLDQR